MSNIPDDIRTMIDSMPPGNRYANFLLNLQLAATDIRYRNEILAYLFNGGSLPESIDQGNKRYAQIARASFLGLPEAKQVELRSVYARALAPASSGGKRGSRKVRRGRKSASRRQRRNLP
jgi:hypothetical protein